MNHGWEKKKIEELCVPKKGILRASVKYKAEDIIEYVDISSIDRNSHQISHTSNYIFKDAPSRAQQVIVRNDILLSLVRPNLKNIACVSLDNSNLIASSGFCVLRSFGTLPRFLLYVITNDCFTDKLVAKCAGAAYPAVREEDVRSILIPVPPMEVQAQIVSELDKINELIAIKRSQLKDLDALAQSLFNETFSSIGETVPLSFYVNALVGGKSLASKEVSPNKVLKSGAVTYDYFDKNSTKYLPVDYTPDAEHSVSTGDLIISRMNTAELVGACAYVFDVDDNVYLPDRLWRIEYKSNANPIYLWKSLISESAKWQIRSKASGTSGSMKNISKPLLLSINIKKVPISIQQQFAERIEAIEEQKKRVEASIADLETILASRMDYWFND